MKKRIKLFFDFDKTIYKTGEVFHKIMLEKGYKLTEGYSIDTTFRNLVEAYNANDDVIRDIFESYELYTYDKDNFYPNVLNIMTKLIRLGFKIDIVTVGEKRNNLVKKSLVKKMELGVKFVGLDFSFYKGITDKEMFDKSKVDMSNGVHIDDNKNSLESSNAKHKILFTKDSDWIEIYNQIIEWDRRK